MAQLQQAHVAVIGVGGVGSHAAHMLARSGIRHVRLIDFDQVTLSSLNRHACATLQDVGLPKATCCQRFCQQICPDPRYCHIEAMVAMYTTETAADLLEDVEWDYVVDAIDDVPTKAALLRHCLQRNWRVISCMGAGGKSDVTRLHISDLRSASRDPLAAKLRQSMKQHVAAQQAAQALADVETDLTKSEKHGENGIDNDGDDGEEDKEDTSSVSYLDDMNRLAVVYSSEKPVVKLAGLTEEQEQDGIHNYGAVEGMRIRILPVLGTMPAIMGQAMAGWCLCELGKKSYLPVPTERVSRAVRNRTFQRLKRREDQITKRILQAVKDKAAAATTGDAATFTADIVVADPIHGGQVVNGQWVGPLQIDSDDVEFLLELWRNRCAVTGSRLGTVLELARWDLSMPSTCDNLVLLGTSAMQQFDKVGKLKIQAAAVRAIEERLQQCRMYYPN